MSTLFVNTIKPQAGSVVAVSGTLEVSGAIKAYEMNTITVSNTTYLGSTSFGNSSGDSHQFTGSMSLSGSGLTIHGAEAGAATINLKADQADDAADTTTLSVADGGAFTVDCGSNIELNADGGTVTIKDASTTLFTFTANDIDVASGNLTFDVAGDIILDADGADVSLKDGGTQFLKFTNNSGNCEIFNGVADKDIIFKDLGGNEVCRIDGSAESLLIASGKKIEFADTGEFITSDGTDLTIASGGDIILNPSGGDVLPNTDNTRSLGSSSKRWANLYTGDLHLKNDRGDWTILEEEDYLCVINNKTGKKFKMMLQEIEE